MSAFGRVLGLVKQRTLHLCSISSSALRSYQCWSCGKDTGPLVSNLFCSHCRTLQRPNQAQNYFNLMNIQETFDVNEDILTKKYKELQKHLHPDKFSNKAANEQLVSEEYSSLVNEAYNTLLQPLSRGIYMLRLKGKEIPESTQIDKEFLITIMEKNEEVENASTEEDILKLNSENKKFLDNLKRELSKAFFDGDLDQVTKILTRMKYYTSIDTQIQSVIRNKGIIR